MDHLYLTLETFPVTLTATGPKGTLTARWPFEVFLLEHVTQEFKEGRLPDYARVAKGYERDKLSAQALKELAHLLSENEEPAEALEVCRLFRKRFANEDAKLVAEVNREQPIVLCAWARKPSMKRLPAIRLRSRKIRRRRRSWKCWAGSFVCWVWSGA